MANPIFERKYNKETLDYKCTWCGGKFSQKVGFVSGKGGGQSVVVCPYCDNRLKSDSNIRRKR